MSLTAFVASVAVNVVANVVSYFIIKWLDR